jgi:hypothetical protein
VPAQWQPPEIDSGHPTDRQNQQQYTSIDNLIIVSKLIARLLLINGVKAYSTLLLYNIIILYLDGKYMGKYCLYFRENVGENVIATKLSFISCSVPYLFSVSVYSTHIYPEF